MHHGGTAEKYNAPILCTTVLVIVVLSGDYCAVVTVTHNPPVRQRFH